MATEITDAPKQKTCTGKLGKRTYPDLQDHLKARAVAGDYLENGRRSAQLRRNGITPNTSIRDVPGQRDDE